MKEPMKNRWNILLLSGLVLLFLVFGLVMPDKTLSTSERRKLKSMPKVSAETIFGKKGGSSFMDDFELYAKDQFPLREQFRRVNALAGRYLLGRKEINDLYVTDGYIAKIEDGLHEKDLDWSVGRFEYILDKYVTDNKVYMALIPDKNYYLAPKAGYPYLDVAEFEARLEERLAGRREFLPLMNLLNRNDYYYTDTHWKQTEVTKVAEYLLTSMDRIQVEGRSEAIPGQVGDTPCDVNTLEVPFYGVYHGQAALPLAPEPIRYLTWEGMDGLEVNCYDTGSAVKMGVYDEKKAEGLDPYEFFLSGSKALITMENPGGKEGELICFRDSFGSSLAPLLTMGYRKVTLVDIRYINPAMLGKFIDFEGADVLLLYSTTVLNNSVGQFIK